MIRWPAKLKPRMDTEHLASTVDLWPTLAALLETETPEEFARHQSHRRAGRGQAQQVFGEQYAHNIADVDHPTRSLENRWMIDGWWKLIAPDPRNQPDAKPELYDLKNDPWEKKDLSAAQPKRVAKMLKQLDEWRLPESGGLVK